MRYTVNAYRVTKQAPIELHMGERIYYTGDICNQSDWGTVAKIESGNVCLQMDNGGQMWVWDTAIGNVYQGHCNPRFVTQTAYDTYRAAVLSR